MKISLDVHDNAPAKGLQAADVLQLGMQEKPQPFLAESADICYKF